MAIMIPTKPYDFDEKSMEDQMFYSLAKLPDDYYVFYSYKTITIKDGVQKEKETDFVIYNKNKGILVIEAKAGKVKMIDGKWYYQSGAVMRDPFEQAESGKWNILKQIINMYKQKYFNDDIKYNCKIMSAVWFSSVYRRQFKGVILPSSGNVERILDRNDLDTSPEETINSIFEIKYTLRNKALDKDIEVVTNLSESMEEVIFNEVLCPTFHILPSKTIDIDYKKEAMHSLIKEQYGLLNYLDEQRIAVINGAAGTGKTMIALEKARRHSVNGEKVLFLCYNKKLQEHLTKNYSYDYVDYFTINGLAKHYTGKMDDFDGLEDRLLDLYSTQSFPYQHIIIDEAQDFGQESMNYCEKIFEAFELITMESEDRTMYVFYDKYQHVQGDVIPKFIDDADCKLTLYKNCRNTRNIAETSFKPLKLKNSKPKMFSAAINGKRASITFTNDVNSKINEAIKSAKSKGYESIQILSCKNDGYSILQDDLNNEYIKYKGNEIPFTTCRKFKGLEADVIILVDIDAKSFDDNDEFFYVGSSRARLELYIITTMNDSECRTAVQSLGTIVKKNDPFQSLATFLNADLIK